MLRLRVHDSSRLEWITEIPIPRGGSPKNFELELSLEIPEHLWTSHDQWERLQLMARLSSPKDDTKLDTKGRIRTVDEMRRSALAIARQAKRIQDELEAKIFAASSLLSSSPHPNLAEELLTSLEAAFASLREGRHTLGASSPTDSPEVARERPLAEEFLSNYVIELVFRVEKAVATHLLGPRCRHPEYQAEAERLRARLAAELSSELAWRKARGLASPNQEDPWELERYVGRVNLVRRHFQGLLFLQVQNELSEARFRPLFAALAATLGGLFVFPLALFFTGGFGITGLSWGLSGTAILVALTYGVRERIKDAARTWIAARVSKNIGGRVTTLTTAPKLKTEAARVLRGSESFALSQGQVADPLHPDLGQTIAVQRLRYRMRGSIHPCPSAASQGSERVKLVFRYDLSPIFSRLDDPSQEVPVLGADGASLRFVDAARCYRIPVGIKLHHQGRSVKDAGILVTHKLGLERLERLSPAPSTVAEAVPMPPREASIPSIAAGVVRRL